MSDALFPSQRGCVVCQATAMVRAKLDPAVPSIVALNVIIYRRSAAGRQLVSTKQVRVCESCLSLILASRCKNEKRAQALADAIFERVAQRYSAMCEVETA